MKYYRFDLNTDSKYGDVEILQKAPVDILEVLKSMDTISNIKEISKTTYYRIQRQDAQRFWNNLEDHMFGETA